MVRCFALAAAWLVLVSSALAADPIEIKIGYLRTPESKTAISLLDVPPENDGVAGAKLAIADNNTTGRFLNQTFRARRGTAEGSRRSGRSGRGACRARRDCRDRRPAAGCAAQGGRRWARSLFFNAGATDERLREEDCRANVIHTAPTRSMLADGLAQYLVWKKWRRWLLVTGSHPKDKLFADALKRAASRFGAKIVQERMFADTGGARRTDSGIVQIQRQIPVFTQSAPDYDVLVAADESDVFAIYLPYRTWDARPVAGSAGLVPKSWDPAHDQWGANQLQNRFVAMFSRRMTERDGNAWAAARMIGEAASRGQGKDPKAMLAFLKSAGFLARRLQGTTAHAPRLESAAPPADPARRRARDRLGFAAGRLPAPGVRA